MDLSKAYDHIMHNLLISFKFMYAYLKGHAQRAEVGSSYIYLSNSKIGVPRDQLLDQCYLIFSTMICS